MISLSDAKRRKKRIALYLAVQMLAIILVIGAFVYRELLDALSSDGKFSACPMHDLLHLYCPGCGGTRAIVALFRGQVIHSLACNPISLYLVVGFLVFDLRAAIAIMRNEERVLTIPPQYFWIMLAFAIVHCVLRNVLMITIGWDYLGDLGAYWHG